MELQIVASLWQYHHPESHGILDKIEIDSRLDKETLWDAIILELGEMECVDRNSECMYKRMKLFFKKWDIPIKELLNTLEYKYNPLENINMQVTRNLGREVVRELGRDICGTLVSEIRRAINEDRTYDGNQTQNNVRNITDNVDSTESNTHTDSHYVSAYDQITPQDSDTYDNRTSGNWSNNSGRDETRSDTSNLTTKAGYTDNKDTSSTDNRDDSTTQNTTENESTGVGENEATVKTGITGSSYQELTDAQRKTVMFNIYNWIIDKFAKEFVIQLW